MLLHAPGLLAPRRVAEPVSLIDLLPTLLEVAGQRRGFRPAVPIDGESLLPAARGRRRARGVVHAEYMAEGTAEPMFMIRRGAFKYVSAPGDPPLLFDLSRDPGETRNLAGRAELAEVEAGFAAEVATEWDAEAIRRDVLASQRARRLVHGALTTGRPHAWDFQPRSDAAKAYYRDDSHPDPERQHRLPAAGPPPRRAE